MSMSIELQLPRRAGSDYNRVHRYALTQGANFAGSGFLLRVQRLCASATCATGFGVDRGAIVHYASWVWYRIGGWEFRFVARACLLGAQEAGR